MYSRISTQEQAKGFSIEAQNKKFKNVCEELDLKNTEILQDVGCSASLKEDQIKRTVKEDRIVLEFPLNNRPRFKEIILRAKEGERFNLFFWRWHRFSRHIQMQEAVYSVLKEDCKINLIPLEDEDNPFIRRLMGSLNQREVDELKDRVHLGMKQKFEERGFPPSKPNFGYRWDRKSKTLLEVPKEIEKVKRLFDMTIKGIHYKKICAELKIPKSSRLNILRNKVYIGIVEYQCEEREFCLPPIISKETFDKANSMIKKKKNWFNKQKRRIDTK